MANNAIIVLNLEAQSELGLDELCEACHVSPDFISELVAYGVLSPKGATIDHWHFTVEQVTTIKRALRLQHDLDVNLAGVALALDLINQVDRLQRQVDLLEKYFSK